MKTAALGAVVCVVASAALVSSRTACAQRVARVEPAPPGPRRAEPPKLPLAAGGYCVVSLHDRQQWVRGDGQFAAQFDGRQYVFAGQRELEIFAAAATAYAPVLSGDCMVTFAQRHERVPGRVELGVVQGGRIYFFASEEARREFIEAPAKFVDADLADGGRCLVSRVEYQRDVAGLPETAVLSGGLRRLFAGAHEQRLYLQQPDRYDQASGSHAASSQLAMNGSGAWRPAPRTPDRALGSPTPELAPTAPGGAGGDAEDADGGTSAGGDGPGKAAGKDDGDRDISLVPEAAMGGYCPVTIRDKGTWARGRYDNRVEIDKLVFFTAGPAEHDAFMANPTRYIPGLGGECAVSLVDYGEHVKGSIFHAAEYQERLFLFADAARKAAFKAGPQRYASIDLAAGGDCVVTLAEERRKQPGFAEFAAWHDGLLYRFAGPEQLAKFLATPEKFAVKAE